MAARPRPRGPITVGQNLAHAMASLHYVPQDLRYRLRRIIVLRRTLWHERDHTDHILKLRAVLR